MSMQRAVRHQLSMESLESRINLASTSVTYTDTDGDVVRIKATLPGSAAPPLDIGDLLFQLNSNQLVRLSLDEAGFDNAKIVFSVTKKPGGDGRAHVGFIDATGVDLKKVVVKGDLGKISAGDATTANDPGLNLLQVRSMGTLGLVTQGNAGDLLSTIKGDLGRLRVAGDFANASLATTFDGRIGSLRIGGDLIGTAETASGQIDANGSIGAVKIGGSVIGGSGFSTGVIRSKDTMGAVTIGGDVRDGGGFPSGIIQSGASLGTVKIGGSLIGLNLGGAITSQGDMGVVRVGRDVTGGAQLGSGRILSQGSIGAVTIGGSITGGDGLASGSVVSNLAMGPVTIGGSVTGAAGHFSGSLSAGGAMGEVKIGGNLVGGSITGAASLTGSGEVKARRITSVTIGGSLTSGSDNSSGELTLCGAIVARETLGKVTIKGSILGNSSNPAVIAATGQAVKPTSGFDIAIASVKVGRDVRFAEILGGFDIAGFFTSINLVPVNADASIGAITAGGDWEASNVATGVLDLGGPGFGTGDELQTVGDTQLVARIASIKIKGTVTGSAQSSDHFGFVAQQVVALKIGSQSLPLDPGPSNDNLLIPLTNDVRLLEVT